MEGLTDFLYHVDLGAWNLLGLEISMAFMGYLGVKWHLTRAPIPKGII